MTGIRALPGFYPEIVKEYIDKHPGEGSILHPLCIVHQIIRRTFGRLNGMEIQQIACQSATTGNVVYSKNGLEKSGLTEEEAKELLNEYACLYLLLREK